MASDILATTKYERSPASLANGVYAVNDDLYVQSADLVLTNNSANQLAGLGIVGSVLEVPDTTNANDRLVFLITSAQARRDGLSLLLKATEL